MGNSGWYEKHGFLYIHRPGMHDSLITGESYYVGYGWWCVGHFNALSDDVLESLTK